MDETIIKNWNNTVGKDDLVYHLGDFAYGKNTTVDYLRRVRLRLNGKIELINGNHEALAHELAKEPCQHFVNVQDYKELNINGQKIILFHYGMRTWHHDLRGAWHLYGHSHDRLKPYGKSFDIGVDSWNFKPLSYEEVKKEMDKREIAKDLPTFSCNECRKFPCRCKEEDGVWK